MGEGTAIEWCDYTFNPWLGCTKVSPGCDHCYAETWANRTGHKGLWGTGAHRLFGDAHWRAPLLWSERARNLERKPRVFCASMADVFDNEAPSRERDRLWRLIEATPHLSWLILTKRIGNAARMLPAAWSPLGVRRTHQNVWLGISVVNQEEAERDIPKLAEIPAVVRFLSCEPLLEAIDLRRVNAAQFVDWIIVGGESGHHARPMDHTWALDLLNWSACNDARFFMKQLSQADRPHTFKRFADFPRELQRREWPR